VRLVIGNKNYSSWSLRPWILLKQARIKFDEVRIPLFTNEGDRLLEELCPAKQVPVLYDGRLVLWDSLAICEYLADKFPDKKLLPLLADVDRLHQLLEQALQDSGGPWLFGHYTVTDAMFAPIATRFQTYGVQSPTRTAEYFEKVLNTAAMLQWFEEASHETEIIEQAEVQQV